MRLPEAFSDDILPANPLNLKQPDAIKGIIASGCPSDPKCFCEDKIFRLELLAGMTTNCSAADMLGEIFPLAMNISDPERFCRDLGEWFQCAHNSLTATQSLAKELCPVLDESREAIVIAVIVVITLLSLVLVALRIVSRKVGHVKFWWEYVLSDPLSSFDGES